MKDFRTLLLQDPELKTSKRALDRHVPTRWNTDFDCLSAHLHFKNIIQAMTGVSEYKLKAYQLNDEQWDLVDDIAEVLMVFFNLFYYINCFYYSYSKILLCFFLRRRFLCLQKLFL